MAKEHVSMDELERALREHGVATCKEAALAVLEVDGSISVLKYEDIEPTASTHLNRRRFLRKTDHYSAGLRGDGTRRFAFSTHPQPGRFPIAHGRNMFPSICQTETRHVAIDAFVLLGTHQISLVPDSYAPVGAHALVESLPRRQMWFGSRAGKRFKGVE